MSSGVWVDVGAKIERMWDFAHSATKRDNPPKFSGSTISGGYARHLLTLTWAIFNCNTGLGANVSTSTLTGGDQARAHRPRRKSLY